MWVALIVLLLFLQMLDNNKYLIKVQSIILIPVDSEEKIQQNII
jgi:hypothetical protein